jgi:hypothetical protein
MAFSGQRLSKEVATSQLLNLTVIKHQVELQLEYRRGTGPAVTQKVARSSLLAVGEFDSKSRAYG